MFGNMFDFVGNESGLDGHITREEAVEAVKNGVSAA